MRQFALIVIASAVAAALPSSANAQVVVNQTFDLTSGALSPVGLHSQGTGLGFSPMVSEQFGVGQTLTLNYDFGDYGLSASNVSLIWANIGLESQPWQNCRRQRQLCGNDDGHRQPA